ncbi:MAG TPA: hypothetical protein VKY92_08220, partial [Verrucomicrobiae bacterium]|nr:hypothetical protein [Verrucomicrobiae bacterium]
FVFQNARTQTEVNDNSAVLPYAGNIYTVMANATYALNERTEIVAGYSFSTANFAQNNFEAGLPLGTHYHQHAFQAGLTRRLGKNQVAGLQYRYYRYSDSSVGNTSGFEAQAVFATLTWRLP